MHCHSNSEFLLILRILIILMPTGILARYLRLKPRTRLFELRVKGQERES